MLNLNASVKPTHSGPLTRSKPKSTPQSGPSKHVTAFYGLSQPRLLIKTQPNGHGDIFFRSGVPSPTPPNPLVTTPSASISAVQNTVPNRLTTAIMAGDIQTFQALLANQSSITDSFCQWAAGCGQPSMLEILFNKTNPPINPIRQAQMRAFAVSQQVKALQYKTWERHQRTQALFAQVMEACIDNNALNECMALLGAGVELNAKGSEGNTLLHTAASLENPPAVQMLLNAGANTHITNDSGSTPLHLAAATGDSESVQRLLAAGANPKALDWDGDTPLKRAIASGDQQTVDLLTPVTRPTSVFYSRAF